ncbi:MAG: hypothetical protein UZ21_OP11001000804 [Microgenomates bacterium OLB22]|nr:MAG: hypothetical protein UZ21_OP11001000804 [Microgenomates bacterium OLB22]
MKESHLISYPESHIERKTSPTAILKFGGELGQTNHQETCPTSQKFHSDFSRDYLFSYGSEDQLVVTVQNISIFSCDCGEYTSLEASSVIQTLGKAIRLYLHFSETGVLEHIENSLSADDFSTLTEYARRYHEKGWGC